MASHWFRKSYKVVPVLVIWALALGVACGTSAQPTVAPADPQPQAPAELADTQAQALPAVPTPVPQEAIAPVDDETAGPKYAPTFESYWSPPTAFYGQLVYGGTLRINFEDPLEHTNIWGARTGAALRYRIPTHNALIQDDPYDSSAPFIPNLAQGWTIHDDLEGVTFFLHEGVKWYNGADLTCEDARFSFETMVTGEGITASYMQNRMADVDPELIECINDRTLEFRFTAPSATPILNFGKTEAVVFNKEWFQAGGEKAMFQDASVGTGPFIWAEGQTVGVDEQHFEKNPDYFIEELPYVDELVIFGILDESAQQAAMLAHQTDWHWVRNFGQYDQYVAHDQIMTGIRATRSSEYLWMNLRKPPFDNLKCARPLPWVWTTMPASL
jgi:ABC-type transport system substrate-binding protein